MERHAISYDWFAGCNRPDRSLLVEPVGPASRSSVPCKATQAPESVRQETGDRCSGSLGRSESGLQCPLPIVRIIHSDFDRTTISGLRLLSSSGLCQTLPVIPREERGRRVVASETPAEMVHRVSVGSAGWGNGRIADYSTIWVWITQRVIEVQSEVFRERMAGLSSLREMLALELD